MSRLIFLDTETTGLDPDRHEIWELAYIIRDERTLVGQEPESRFLLEPDLTRADPGALRVNGYYKRTEMVRRHSQSTGMLHNAAQEFLSDNRHYWSDPAAVAEKVARDFDGAHVVGAVPDFDVSFLKRLLFLQGQAWTAHYHLIDVEALLLGWLLGTGKLAHFMPPWKSDALTQVAGIDSAAFERHTALSDARWARAIYDKVLGVS